MADTNTRVEPTETQTTATVPTAAPQSAPSSLQQDLVARAQKATTPADIAAILAEARKPAPKAEKPAAAAAPPKQEAAQDGEGKVGETPAETSTEQPQTKESAPEGETPPAENAETTEPAADAETSETTAQSDADTETEAEPDAGQPLKPSTAKKIGLRVPEDDKVGRMATALMQRNRDMTMEQAIVAAKDRLGIKPTASDQAAAAESSAPAAPKPNADLPQTVEAVDTEQDRLMDLKEKAADELNLTEVAKIDRQLRRLDRHRGDLQRQESEAAAQQEATYRDTFAASEAAVLERYPQASDPNSAFHKRMMEIDEDNELRGSVLYYDPKRTEIIADMVAVEMRVAPRRKGSPAAPAKPAATTPPATAKPKQVIPGGASRTTPVTTAPQQETVKQIANIKTEYDLHNYLRNLGVKNV